MQATEAIRLAKKMLGDTSASNALKCKLRGDLEVRLAMHLLKKKGKDRKVYASIDEVLQQFTSEAKAANLYIDSWPWQPPAKTEEGNQPAKMQFTEDGRCVVTRAYVKEHFKSMSVIRVFFIWWTRRRDVTLLLGEMSTGHWILHLSFL